MKTLEQGQTMTGKLGRSEVYDVYYFFPDVAGFSIVTLKRVNEEMKEMKE